MRQEKLSFLANNPFYTKRFYRYVGRRCRSSTIKDVAKELKLDWKCNASTPDETEKERGEGCVEGFFITIFY